MTLIAAKCDGIVQILSLDKWGSKFSDEQKNNIIKRSNKLHEEVGACAYCCDRCNYDNHRCHFCGDPLRHDDSPYDLPVGSPNPCYVEARNA